MRRLICIRGQKSKGKWPHQGPDTYVAVMEVPEGVTPPKQMRNIRGILVVHFGEGYNKRCGPTSSLGRAIRAAQEYCWAHEVGPIERG